MFERERILVLAVLLASGGALAAFVSSVDPRGLGQEAATVFLLATSALAIGRAIVHRLRGSWLYYQQELAAVLLGSACVLGAMQGVDAIQVVLTWWGVLAVGGSAIVRPALSARSHA